MFTNISCHESNDWYNVIHKVFQLLQKLWMIKYTYIKSIFIYRRCTFRRPSSRSLTATRFFTLYSFLFRTTNVSYRHYYNSHKNVRLKRAVYTQGNCASTHQLHIIFFHRGPATPCINQPVAWRARNQIKFNSIAVSSHKLFIALSRRHFCYYHDCCDGVITNRAVVDSFFNCFVEKWDV